MSGAGRGGSPGEWGGAGAWERTAQQGLAVSAWGGQRHIRGKEHGRGQKPLMRKAWEGTGARGWEGTGTWEKQLNRGLGGAWKRSGA